MDSLSQVFNGVYGGIVTFSQEFPAIYQSLILIAGGLGIMLCGYSLITYVMAKKNNYMTQQRSMGGMIVSLIAGMLLLQVRAYLKAGTESVFRQSEITEISTYVNKAQNMPTPFEAGFYAIIAGLVLVGWIVGIRSLFLLWQAGEGVNDGKGSLYSRAFWHFVGGIILVNQQHVVLGVGQSFGVSESVANFNMGP